MGHCAPGRGFPCDSGLRDRDPKETEFGAETASASPAQSGRRVIFMALRALPRPLPALSPDGTLVPRCGGRLTTHVRLLTHAVQCSRRLAPNRDRQGADA